MSIWTQKSASIQPRTSPLKFDDFAEKSEKDSIRIFKLRSFPCPLMIASRDDAGGDILGAPIAHVQIPTKIPAVRCAVRDVRLLFYV